MLLFRPRCDADDEVVDDGDGLPVYPLVSDAAIRSPYVCNVFGHVLATLLVLRAGAVRCRFGRQRRSHGRLRVVVGRTPMRRRTAVTALDGRPVRRRHRRRQLGEPRARLRVAGGRRRTSDDRRRHPLHQADAPDRDGTGEDSREPDRRPRSHRTTDHGRQSSHTAITSRHHTHLLHGHCR